MKTAIDAMAALIRLHRGDIAIGLLLGVALATLSYQGAKLVPPGILDYNRFDVWFEGDMPRVYDNLIDSHSDHDRTKAHPLLILLTHPTVCAVKKVFHLKPLTTVRLVYASTAFFWMAFLFALLRLNGCQRLDTVLLCLLASVSAASLFWFTVPETFSFGSLTILIALLIVPLSQRFALSPAWYVVVNVLTLGVVITNWLVGILVTAVGNPIRRALNILAWSFSLVTVLWAVQKYIYPTVVFFLGEHDYRTNWNFLNPESSSTLQVAGSFFYHTLIMPAIGVVHKTYKNEWPIMVTQFSNPGSAGGWGMCAVTLWTILLGIGIWVLFTLKEHFRWRLVLGLITLAQLGLHVVYGDETFLYALHLIVLLIPLAALGSLTRLRPVVLALVVLLIPCVAINNITQFHKATEMFSSPDLAPAKGRPQ